MRLQELVQAHCDVGSIRHAKESPLVATRAESRRVAARSTSPGAGTRGNTAARPNNENSTDACSADVGTRNGVGPLACASYSSLGSVTQGRYGAPAPVTNSDGRVAFKAARDRLFTEAALATPMAAASVLAVISVALEAGREAGQALRTLSVVGRVREPGVLVVAIALLKLVRHENGSVDASEASMARSAPLAAGSILDKGGDLHRNCLSRRLLICRGDALTGGRQALVPVGGAAVATKDGRPGRPHVLVVVVRTVDGRDSNSRRAIKGTSAGCTPRTVSEAGLVRRCVGDAGATVLKVRADAPVFRVSSLRLGRYTVVASFTRAKGGVSGYLACSWARGDAAQVGGSVTLVALNADGA